MSFIGAAVAWAVMSLLGGLAASPANAERQPTASERSAISQVVRARLLGGGSRGLCAAIGIDVSTVSDRYAYIETFWRGGGACVKYPEVDAQAILKWSGSTWRIIQNGFEVPYCSQGLMPEKVIEDLFEGAKCER